MYPTGVHHHPRPRRGPSDRPPRRRLAATLVTAGLGLGLTVGASPPPAGALTTSEVTGRVSVHTDGSQVTGSVEPRVAADGTGRLVAFTAGAAFAPGDTNGTRDVYVRDRLAGTTSRVSVTNAEQQLNGPATLCGASGDLRFVGFTATAANLPGGGTTQVYVRDRLTGATQLASSGAGGLPSAKPGGGSGIAADGRCDISLDGRYVVFASEGTNLVADGNAVSDVFRRDRTTSTTVRISQKNNGTEITGFGAADPQISDDGDRVVFSSRSQIVGNDDNQASDVFLRYVDSDVTHRLSNQANGDAANDASTDPAISGDGETIAFASAATNIASTGADENGDASDVYAGPADSYPRERVSVSSTDDQGDDDSWGPSLSTTGRHVAFVSEAGNLWLLEGNGGADVFRHDRQTGLTVLFSRRVESAVSSVVASDAPPAVAGEGGVVAFTSTAQDLVRNDTNGGRDAFVRDVAVDHSPFDSFDELVAQQFADFAGRAPTAAEATTWRQRLRHGEVSPDQVITALAHSSAWSQHRGPVTRLYWAFFLRAPDAGGLDYWVAQKAGGKGLHTIAGQFARSKEFKDTYGALSNGAFVTLVYQNVLQRDPAAGEVAYWKGELDAGRTTRGSVMVGFSESAEGRRVLAPQVDVVLVHLGMLGAVPSGAEHAELAGSLVGGEPLEALVRTIRRTDLDYIARVG